MDQYAAHYVPLSSTLYLRVNKTWNVFMKTGLSGNNTKKPWCVKLDFLLKIQRGTYVNIHVWMNSKSHNLHYLNIYDTKPGLKTNVQNCYCDNCFVSFPQSLHYHFLWQRYCFPNAAITPRKTNVSPKMIAYTLSVTELSRHCHNVRSYAVLHLL